MNNHITFKTFVFILSLFSLTCNAQSAYEVWASDQSNSVRDVESPGTSGSYIWIWDSADIQAQLAGHGPAQPLACGKHKKGKSKHNQGPCNLLDVFPQSLVEMHANGTPTGNVLADLNGFGRLHGMLPDPQNRYVTANIFAPSGGYVGIIDTETKEAISLFRVTGTNVGGGTDVRSVHMSFWDSTGSAIIIANLHGKVLERIDIKRNRSGKIKQASFNRSASLGVGKSMQITAEATYFLGKNQHGKPLIGNITGDYANADFNDLTPNGVCKENGCTTGLDGEAGGRPNNVIICPIPSTNRNAYITMGGGGLLIAKTDTTPMTIVGEYGNQVINGAGCGGAEANEQMWINAGVSASGAGATQSTFSMYAIDDTAFNQGANLQNQPAPTVVFKDPSNTNTIGNTDGVNTPNLTGQFAGESTRRDAHGVAVTQDKQYIHNVDRIQNIVEVFDTISMTRTTYDLTSADGQGYGIGACADASIRDANDLLENDPAPDLLESTPDGKYLMIAFRGPRPVSVRHSAQGSCPGVGIVELLDNGQSGQLISVLRTTNTTDNSGATAPGGYAYTGAEHSDIHAATVVRKGKKLHKSRKSRKAKKARWQK